MTLINLIISVLILVNQWPLAFVNQLIELASGSGEPTDRSTCLQPVTHPPCRQIDKRLIQHSMSDRPIVCLSLSALLIQEPFVTLHLPSTSVLK